jgi:hypothetical protein
MQTCSSSLLCEMCLELRLSLTIDFLENSKFATFLNNISFGEKRGSEVFRGEELQRNSNRRSPLPLSPFSKINNKSNNKHTPLQSKMGSRNSHFS